VILVSVQEFCAPEFLSAKQIILRGVTAREREPLHVVTHSYVVGGWIIQAGMRGGSGHDRRQMSRKFFCRCPLIEARVRPAPHGHFAVRKRLLCQPLNDVVSIARFICERLELAAGIPAAANID
jgi:hypothetical protein